MKCGECNSLMIHVGTEYKPGNRSVWAKGRVCSDLPCTGYAQSHHDGTSVQSTALTLDPGTCLVHARIAGALDFKRGIN